MSDLVKVQCYNPPTILPNKLGLDKATLSSFLDPLPQAIGVSQLLESNKPCMSRSSFMYFY